MVIEERKPLRLPLSDIPYGGIFKSLCGNYYMKIRCDAADLNRISVVNIKTGSFDLFRDDAVIERYYENSRLILE